MTYAQVVQNGFQADEYREFIARHFNMALWGYASSETWWRCVRHVRALSKITKIAFEELWSELADDAERIYG